MTTGAACAPGHSRRSSTHYSTPRNGPPCPAEARRGNTLLDSSGFPSRRDVEPGTALFDAAQRPRVRHPCPAPRRGAGRRLTVEKPPDTAPTISSRICLRRLFACPSGDRRDAHEERAPSCRDVAADPLNSLLSLLVHMDTTESCTTHTTPEPLTQEWGWVDDVPRPALVSWPVELY